MNEEQLNKITNFFWEDDEYSLSQRNARDKDEILYLKKIYASEIEYAYDLLKTVLNINDSLEKQMAIAYSIFETDENNKIPESIYLDILEVFWENNLKGKK